MLKFLCVLSTLHVFILGGGLADRAAVDESLHSRVLTLMRTLKSLEQQHDERRASRAIDSGNDGTTTYEDAANGRTARHGGGQLELAPENRASDGLNPPEEEEERLVGRASSLVQDLVIAAEHDASQMVGPDQDLSGSVDSPGAQAQRGHMQAFSDDQPVSLSQQGEAVAASNAARYQNADKQLVLDQMRKELALIQAASGLEEPIPELEFSNLDTVIREMHGYVKEFRNEFVGDKPIQAKALKNIADTQRFYDMYRDLDSGYEAWTGAVGKFRQVLKDSHTDEANAIKAATIQAANVSSEAG